MVAGTPHLAGHRTTRRPGGGADAVVRVGDVVRAGGAGAVVRVGDVVRAGGADAVMRVGDVVRAGGADAAVRVGDVARAARCPVIGTPAAGHGGS